MYYENFDLEVKDAILTLVSKTEFNIICSKSSSITDLEIDQLNPWFYTMNTSLITSDSDEQNQKAIGILDQFVVIDSVEFLKRC